MDGIDRQILELLQENSRISHSELGKIVKLSIPAVSARIRKLESSGIIERYTVAVNREKLGLKLVAFVFVNLAAPEHSAAFRSAIAKLQPVLECHHVAGSYDYLLKVLVEDTRALEDFITGSLKTIPGVVRSNTFIALSSIKTD